MSDSNSSSVFSQPTNQPACLFVYSGRHLLLLLFFFSNRGRADAPNSPGVGDGRGPHRGGFSGCSCPHSSVTGSRITAEKAAAKDSERRASSSSSSSREGEEGWELREVNGVVVVVLSGLVPAWSGCCQDPPSPSHRPPRTPCWKAAQLR